MEVKQIRTNIKTSDADWNIFRAACVGRGLNSGDVLGNYIKNVNLGNARLYPDQEPADAPATV